MPNSVVLPYEIVQIEGNVLNWLGKNIVWGHNANPSIQSAETIAAPVKSPPARYKFGDDEGESGDGRWDNTGIWLDNRECNK
jgi:hypothetical protein